MGFFDDIDKAVSRLTSDISRSDLGVLLGPMQTGGFNELEGDFDKYSQRLGFNGYGDMLVQGFSGGGQGIDENGDLKWGDTGQWLDEGVGEISGRNAQRAALHQQEKNYRAEEARREQIIQEEKNRRFQEDIAASNSAGNGRRLYGGRSGSATGVGGLTTTLGEQRDFLGL